MRWVWALGLAVAGCTAGEVAATATDTGPDGFIFDWDIQDLGDFGSIPADGQGGDAADGFGGPPDGVTNDVPPIGDINAETPCSPNPCTDTPLQCDGDVLRRYGPGQCSEPDGGIACDYPIVETLNCAENGYHCTPTVGICVQCVSDTDCNDTSYCDLGSYECKAICTPDSLEDNDSLDTPAAFPLNLQQDGLFVCGEDPDFYSVPLPDGGDLTVKLTTPFVGGFFELTLVDPAGDVAQTGVQEGNTWRLSGTALLPGTYTLAVTTPVAQVILPYSLSIIIASENPCDPNPCTNPPSTLCDGNTLVSFPAVGACTIAEGAAVCDFQANPGVDCSPGYCLDTKCAPYRPAKAGDLVIAELMLSPLSPVFAEDGQWVELHNVSADTVTVEGATLTSTTALGDDVTTVQGPLYVAAGKLLIFGRNVDPKQNGGLVVDYLLGGAAFDPTVGHVALRNAAGETLDEVSWNDVYPIAPGASLTLLPSRFGPELNDTAADWCAAKVSFGKGGNGSPGSVNGPCSVAVSLCAVSLPPASGELYVGAARAIHGWAIVPGITDLTPSFDANALVIAQRGYGSPGTDPAGWGSWFTLGPLPLLAWGAGLDGADQFGGTVSPPLGSWEVAVRVSGDAGATWTYCDQDLGEGHMGSEDGYSSSDAISLEVLQNPCLPNPCAPKPPECVGDVLRQYGDALGACAASGGQTQCAYASTGEKDCKALGLICNAEAGDCVPCDTDADCDAPFGVCNAGTCVALCQDDAGEDDDTDETAREAVVGPVDSGRVICAGDPDVSTLLLEAGESLSITVGVSKGATVLVEIAREGQGAALVFAAGAAPTTQVLSVPVGEGGRYFIRVRAPAGKQSVYSVALSTTKDPCIPDPCAPTVSVCDGKQLRTKIGGTCDGSSGAPQCSYSDGPTQSCPNFCTNDACTEWRLPTAGELVVTEVSAVNGWVEITSASADLLTLKGLSIAGPGYSLTCTAASTLAPGATIVLSPTLVSGALTLVCDASGSVPAAGTLTVSSGATSSGATIVDTATYDATSASGAVGLDPKRGVDATANDETGAFCRQRTTYDIGGVGTPGGPNDKCPFTIDWCRIQYPPTLSVVSGQVGAVYGRVYIAGWTTQTTGVDVDPLIVAQAGIGADGTLPTSWSLWIPMAPTPGYNGETAPPSPEPNNDEYTVSTPLPLPAGRYDAAVRFSGDGGISWTYCDLGSSDPTQDGSANGYQPGSSIDLEIQ